MYAQQTYNRTCGAEALEDIKWVTNHSINITEISRIILNWNSQFGNQGGKLIGTKFGHFRENAMLRCIFTMWRPAARAVRIDKQLNHIAKKERERKRDIHIKDLEQCIANKDEAGKYHCMRVLGGAFRGPKKRKLNVPLTEYPTVEEWESRMSQKGIEGGCDSETQIITKTPITQKAITLESHHDEDFDTGRERRRLFTSQNIYNEFKNGK